MIFNKENGDFNYTEMTLQETEEDYKAFKGLYAVAQREKGLDTEYRNKKKNESK